MSIIKKENFTPSSSFFDDFFTRDLFNWPRWTEEKASLPRVNIVETNDDFRVEMAAPGLKKDDFHVELNNDMLTIYSEKQENAEDQEKYTHREFGYNSFRRTFYLPNTVEADKIEAKYSDGVLRLAIPKKEEARKKPTRTIKIS